MIERMMNMSTKNDYTIEELQKKCEEAKKNFECLNGLLEEKKKEEKELREAQLAEEADARKKEVDDALEKYKTLLRAYMRDYGSYAYVSNDNHNIFDSKFWNYYIL
jgi:chromosome segregation ATPase